MLKSSGRKELVIVGGPNGSGKTTLAKEYLQIKDYEYLSADDIAFEINPENPASVRLEAGKEFFRRFERFINEEKNILIESTLSGKSLINIINRVQTESNYFVTLIFIFLDDDALCIERVKTRVSKGGHNIPKEDIIRRFGRSIVNFWNTYRYLSDQWVLFYNSEDRFQEVAHNHKDQIYVYDEPLFLIFKEIERTYE